MFGVIHIRVFIVFIFKGSKTVSSPERQLSIPTSDTVGGSVDNDNREQEEKDGISDDDEHNGTPTNGARFTVKSSETACTTDKGM